VAACVAGTSHFLARRRCEDSWSWALGGDSRLAVAVADGVGSAGRGGEGADLVVEVASRWLAFGGQGGAGLGEGDSEQVCEAAIAAANRELAACGGSVAGELATTLVVASVDGSGKAALARVGDSTAMLLERNGTWQELFGGGGVEEDDGPLLGLTAALPVEGSPFAEIATADLANAAALVLMTDGLAEPLRDGPGTVAPAFGALVRQTREGEVGPLGLAHALSFSRRGAHDDRCAVVVWLAR
jgi:hypothetical protein